MHTEVNIRHSIANTHGGAGRGVEAGGRGAREARDGGGNTTGKHCDGCSGVVVVVVTREGHRHDAEASEASDLGLGVGRGWSGRVVAGAGAGWHWQSQ